MLKELEVRMGYAFVDKLLLETALTHRSFLNEHRSADEHNERLEFLGDAVLELIVTEYLYRNYPHKAEGELTTWRSALVKGERLAELAKELNLGEYLKLSRGEARSGGREKNYLLANAFEAILGAMYLDGGFDAVRQFIARILLPRLEFILKEGAHIDAKSRLQELAQEKRSITPEYRLLGESGPDHAKEFVMGAFFGKEQVGTGKGASKQTAEQDAAKNALKSLEWA